METISRKNTTQSKFLEYLRIGLLFLIGARYLYVFFVFTWGQGLWITEHRPDTIDVGSYYIAGHILKDGNGHKIYDYNFQEKYLLNDLLPYFNKFKEFKGTIPSYIFAEHIKAFKQSNGLFAYFYYYPPNSLPALYALSWLPLNVLYLCINFLSLIMLLGAFFLSTKKYWNEQKNRNFLYVLFAGIIVFSPTLCNFLNAQLALISSLAFYFYYYFSKQKKFFLAGLFLSITLIKPQIGLPLVLIAILLRDKKSFAYCALVTLLLCLLAYLLIGYEGYKDYFISSLQLAGFKNFGIHPHPVDKAIHSIYYLGFKLLGQNNYCEIKLEPILKTIIHGISLCSTIAMIWIASLKRFSQTLKITILSLLSMFVFSYHHLHDYVLLLSTLFIVIEENASIMKKATIYFIGLFVFLSNVLSTMLSGPLYSLNTIATLLLYLFSILTILLLVFIKPKNNNEVIN
jgi:hypothetical protein